MHRKLKKVQDLIGFSAENTKGGDVARIITRGSFTSDEAEFYQYSEQISNIILNAAGIQTDFTHQFLILIHNDLTADIYLNNFNIGIEIKAKRDIKGGEVVRMNDIADIRRVKFPDIKIEQTDRIIYCFKIGWRFGLFFDFSAHENKIDSLKSKAEGCLNIDQMELYIGDLRRRLTFHHVYKTFESEGRFDEMLNDGWFPFIEIINEEYKVISSTYKNKFDFDNKIKKVVDSFHEERIRNLTEKWWKNEIFLSKKVLIEAGISAYLNDNQEGYINCIKNLWTEIEGILRIIYQSETGKGDHVKASDLINHIVEKGKSQSGSDHSLILPFYFLRYMEEVVFANFNLEKGEVDMSRNSSSHGVAEIEQYTKDRALQLILILDQIYFYLHS